MVFEAARRAGAPRVIFASSNHAVGFIPRSAFPVPDYAFPKPDTYYGVSKAAVEALAAMYHSRYGMDSICLRILSCFPRPQNVRMLSPGCRRTTRGVFEACLTAERPGFRVALGGSANTRGGWVSLAEARALGYQRRTTRRPTPGVHRRARQTGPGRPGAALPGRQLHPPGRADPPAVGSARR